MYLDFCFDTMEQKSTRKQEEGLLAIEVVISIIRVTPCKKMVGGAERSGAEALLFESSFFLYLLRFLLLGWEWDVLICEIIQ